VNPDHLDPVSRPENARRTGPYRRIAFCRQRGHPLDEANIYVRPSGERECRACRDDRKARFLERRRAAREIAAR
jgi:hypothetical protein